jgi:hypothetical protein
MPRGDVLALRTEEAPASALSVHQPVDFPAARGARAPSIHFEILTQRKHSSQLEETKREHPRIGHNLPEPAHRQILHACKGTRSCAVKDLVFDDVADAGEDRLVEKNVRDLSPRICSDLSHGGSWIPLSRHDIGGEVVAVPGIGVFHEFHGGGPYGHLAVGKFKHQAWWARAAVVARHRYAFKRRRERAPQHEMHAQRERVELENEMLPPRKDRIHGLTCQALDADFAVAGYSADATPREGPKLFGCEMQRGTFHVRTEGERCEWTDRCADNGRNVSFC